MDHIIRQVNRGFESHTGYKAEDILGVKASQLVSHIDTKWYHNHDKVVKTGRPMHIESYYPDLGRWYDVNMDLSRWYDVNILPYSDNMFAELSRDITDRKKAEEERRRSRRILQDIQQLFDHDCRLSSELFFPVYSVSYNPHQY